MSKKLTDLTIDMTKLRRMPVQERLTFAKQPGVASDIFGNLTPSQIASLFPKYYMDKNPAMSGMMKATSSSYSGGGSGGGGSSSYSSGGTSGGNSSGSSSSGGGYTPKLSLTQRLAQAAGIQTSDQYEVTQFAKRWGISPRAAHGVLNIESGIKSDIRGGAGGNFYGVFQLQGGQIAGLTEKAGFGKLTPDEYRKLSVRDQLKVMDEYYKQWKVPEGFFTGDPKTDAAKMWALQLAPGNAKRIDYSNPGAQISPSQQAGIISDSSGGVSVGSAANGSMESSKGIYTDEMEKNDLAPDPTATPPNQSDATKPGETTNQNTNGTTDIATTNLPTDNPNGNTANVTPVPAFQFDVTKLNPDLQAEYNHASESEKKTIEQAVQKIGYDKANEIRNENPTASPSLATAEIKKEGQIDKIKPVVFSQEGLQEFWKGRNPRGTQLTRVDPIILKSYAEAIQQYEAANPNYRVEAFGPGGGTRTTHATNHGIKEDGYGKAIDLVIIDKTTGKQISNLGRSGYAGQEGGSELGGVEYAKLHGMARVAQEHFFP